MNQQASCSPGLARRGFLAATLGTAALVTLPAWPTWTPAPPS